MKGIIAFGDDPDRFVVQSVHMLLEGNHQRPWKEGEARTSRLVFIGRNLPKEALRAGLSVVSPGSASSHDLAVPFVQKRSEDLKGAADRIKIWTREALSLCGRSRCHGFGDQLSRSQLPWRGNSDPRNDPRAATRMIRIACPLAEVRLADLEAAL